MEWFEGGDDFFDVLFECRVLVDEQVEVVGEAVVVVAARESGATSQVEWGVE